MLAQVSPPIGVKPPQRKPFMAGMSNDLAKPLAMPPTGVKHPWSAAAPTMATAPVAAANEVAPGMMPPTPAQSPLGARTSAPVVNGNSRYGSDNARPGTPTPVGGNVNPAWNPQGGVSPFNASSGATGIGDFQRFSDNAYNESVRRLDPQFAEQQRGFEQDMVNRGISPGTDAYDNARQNFEQSRSDAYAGARAQADQMGLAAQQQSFGQGQQNSQGLRELLLGQMGLDASRYGADSSANASMYNSNQAAQSAANRLGFDQQQGDWGNMMQLLGFGSGINAQNNGTIGQNNSANNSWYNQNGSLLGQFSGGGNPSQIDVNSPYNNQYNAGLNTAQFNQQQNNANNQMYAQALSSLLCDRDAKDEIATVDPADALKAIESIPLVCWTYKAGVDRAPHVGTYAQDFNTAIGLPPNTMIQTIDLFGALIGSVQALTARIKELEAA